MKLKDENIVRVEMRLESLRPRRRQVHIGLERRAELGFQGGAQLAERRMKGMQPVEDNSRTVRMQPVQLRHVNRLRPAEILGRIDLAGGVDEVDIRIAQIERRDDPVDVVERKEVLKIAGVGAIDVQRRRFKASFKEMPRRYGAEDPA
jgi:hypothetical protein